jgi:hypothetical protein
MTPRPDSRRALLVSGGLAVASLVSFVMGVASLGIGLAIRSSSTGAASGPSGGGLFSRIGRIVSNAVPSSGGPDKPGYAHGRPVGLYLMTRYWMTTHSLEKAVWYFTSDGRVYVNIEDGFSDDKLAAHKGLHGTAAADGDNIVVTWSDGTKESSPVERQGSGFAWDMGLFVPVERFPDDSSLAGLWEGGTSVTFGGSHAATSNTLDLRRDGKFTGASVASLRSESDGSAVSGGSQGTNGGSWRLDGYSLTLTYDDGRVVRGIAFPFNDEKSERFYFAGTMYKKQS